MSTEAVPDAAIPKRLRQAIDLRSRALLELREAIFDGGSGLHQAKRVTDLDRLIQRREWLPRVEGFDPIALGC